MKNLLDQPPTSPLLWDASEAACRQSTMPLILFFPDSKNPMREKLAKRYCNGDSDHPPCPLRQKCLEWALYAEESGIWGGKSESERRKYLKTYGKVII